MARSRGAHRARPEQSPRSPLGDVRGQLIQFRGKGSWFLSSRGLAGLPGKAMATCEPHFPAWKTEGTLKY